MSNDARKISELGIAPSAYQTDRIVILTNPSSSPAVQTISINAISSSLRYANTSAAGVVKVGDNLTINASGHISAYYPAYANNSVAGIIKVGNNLTINATGFLNAQGGPIHVTSFVTSTPHTANSSEEIILCDPNAASANIVVNLPVPTANGRVFTVKNLNDGGSNVYHVEVYANNGSSVIEMHGVGGFNTYDLVASSGNTVTWVYYDGYYRVINYG